MKNLVYIFLFIAFCIGGCSKYTAPTSWQLPSEERSKYPTWQISGMETKNILYPDNSFKWKLEYRDKEKDSSFEPYVFCIPIASQYSLQLNISSKKGTPVLLLSDRKSNSFDMQSILSKKYTFGVDFYPNFSRKGLEEYYKNPSYHPSEYKPRCLSPWLVAYVFPDGSVRPCLNSTYSFGDINNQKLTDIWNSQKAVVFRKTLKQSKIFPACSRCTELYRY